jgi:hypothetical protein
MDHMDWQILNRKCFLSYATANEQLMYWDDFANFLSLARYDPGVDQVEMFIAVSEVVPRTVAHEKIVNELVNLLRATPNIKVRTVSFKSNVGRDFSSHACNLRKIAKEADPGDFILFTNRSACGPFKRGWYSEYVRQYKKFENVALCGSSINFNGHLARPRAGICTHVQSFAMLSQLTHLAPLLADFPAEHETDRDDIIANGEIGLSACLMNEGKSITCLAWPDHAFNLKFPYHPDMPLKYLKLETREQPFRFKLWDNPPRLAPLTSAIWFYRVLRCWGLSALFRACVLRMRAKLSRKAHRAIARLAFLLRPASS